MKFKIAGVKCKFKKSAAPAVLRWLSGIVHTLAAVEHNQNISLRDATPLCFGVPAAITATDADMPCAWVEIDGAELPALKAARRKVASFVQLGQMQ